MPELPEVETVVREIRPKIVGNVILSSKFTIPRQLLPQTPRAISQALKNQKIKTVARRGKYILIELDKGTLLVHLRMTGRLYVRPISDKHHEHERAVFNFKDSQEALVFRDPRTLGTLRYFPSGTPIHPIAILGWEPLADKVLAKELKEKLSNRSMAIKPVLLDQTLWAGIGNIYASEALWESKIHPSKSSDKLTVKECEKLIEMIPKVLERALKKGGSTLRDFMSPDGQAGSYQKEFCVYGREDEPCFCCKTSIKKITQAQRSTYFCPKCQKK